MSAYLDILFDATEKPKQYVFGSRYEANIARTCIESAAKQRGMTIHILQKERVVTVWSGEMQQIHVAEKRKTVEPVPSKKRTTRREHAMAVEALLRMSGKIKTFRPSL